MSKRVRITTNDESKDEITETNSIYIPQVKINYGAYGQNSNIVNIEKNEEDNTDIGGTVGLIDNEHVGFHEDDYVMYGNDWNVEDLSSLNLNIPFGKSPSPERYFNSLGNSFVAFLTTL